MYMYMYMYTIHQLAASRLMYMTDDTCKAPLILTHHICSLKKINITSKAR